MMEANMWSRRLGSLLLALSAVACVEKTEIPSITSVEVYLADMNLDVGQTVQAIATAKDMGGTTVAGAMMTWRSSSTAVATVSPSGLVTGVGAGTATITATSEGTSGTAVVRVSPVAVARVTVALGTTAIAPGGTTQATATAYDASNNVLLGRSVAWTSSNPAVATVSGSGLVTGIATGTASITAVVDGVTGAASLDVKQPTPAPVAQVVVTLPVASLYVGGTAQATVVPKDASGNTLAGRVVTWATSNALVATVDASGLVTGVGAGTVEIRATSEGVTGGASLTVALVPVATVTVSLGSTSLVVGQTTQAAATTRDASGNALTGRAVTWQSSNEMVATVSAAGVVTGVGVGTATITATSEGKVGTASVNVGPVVVARVVVALGTLAIAPGGTTQATATAYDATNNVLSGRNVTWTSSNTGVATVSMSGLVTGIAMGTASITATVDGVSGSASLEVKLATGYAVGGAVFGLRGDGLVLSTPGQPDLAVPAGVRTFAFSSTVAPGTSYTVRVKTQPAGQQCVVIRGAGSVGSQDVSTVTVNCDVWKRVVAGPASSSHAIARAGTLWSWGSNALGQLGDGTTVNRSSPVPVGSATDWVAVTSGGSHTVGLKADGSLWAWGMNSCGGLGDGTTTNRLTPVQVGTSSGWASVAAGSSNTAAIRVDGTLWAWGANYAFATGPNNVTCVLAPVQIGTATDWSQVAAGDGHNVALKKDGTLWTWGSNTWGQLGDGTTTYQRVPVQIDPAMDWVWVDAGDYNGFAMKADGSLWAWGWNGNGELGDGTNVNRLQPVKIGVVTAWASMDAGHYHTVALQADGSLWAWGQNGYGQLGDGTTVFQRVPTKIGFDTSWASVSAGIYHTIASKADGTLWAWGYNVDGQLGDGTTTTRQTPVQIGSAIAW